MLQRRNGVSAPSGSVSRRMGSVRQRGTKPERTLRSALFASGLRYRVNQRSLPGSPDIVFSGARVAVFVNGCFWHHHRGCPRATIPKTNTLFWMEKFAANRSRDAAVRRSLIAQGWFVRTVWECEVGNSLLEIADRIKEDLVVRGK